MNIKTILTLFLLTLSTAVFADTAEESLSFAKGGAKHTIKTVVKTYSDEGLKFWLVSKHLKPFVVGDYKAGSINYLYKANCTNGELSLLEEVYYSPAGSSIHRMEYEEEGGSLPPPNSLAEMASNKACNAWELSRKTVSPEAPADTSKTNDDDGKAQLEAEKVRAEKEVELAKQQALQQEKLLEAQRKHETRQQFFNMGQQLFQGLLSR